MCTATGTRRRRRGSQREIAQGHDVLLEIDWQGAAQVRRLIPDAVAHLHPAAVARLAAASAWRSAGQDSPEVIARRLEAAREEMRALRRVRLCYYESGLCESRRRPVRDRARGAPRRAAAGGAARGAHAAIASNPRTARGTPWPASPSKTVSTRFPTASSSRSRRPTARARSAPAAAPLVDAGPRQADRHRAARNRRRQGRHRNAAEGARADAASRRVRRRVEPR